MSRSTLFRRFVASIVVSGMAVALPLAGVATAADPPPPVADPTGEGKVCEDAPDQEPFTDVTAADPSYDEIVCLYQADITKGRTATSFAPNGTVTRREMALFLVRLGDTADRNDTGGKVERLPAYDGTPDYSDLGGESATTQAAIGRLSQAGIAQGFGDGTYRPGATLKRRQMAKFIVRVLEFVSGDQLPAPSGDYFDDDDGDTGETEFNQLAEAGVFAGNGAGSVNPGGDLTRRQMANILLRTLQNRFEAGDITALFATENKQSIEVTPSDAAVQDLSQDDDREYAASGLTAGRPYRITLVAGGNVTIDSTGRARFATTTPTSGDCNGVRIADAGPPAARLISINGSAVSPNPDHTQGAVTPVNRVITFVIEGLEPETVVPVVYEDNDATGCTFLEVDQNGVPTETFGVGGATKFVPAEAPAGPISAREITFVDKVDDFFVANGLRYDYDSGDAFFVDGTPGMIAAFEAALSSSDAVEGGYSPEPEGPSTFRLTNSNPGTPTGVTATRSAGGVIVSWTPSGDDVDSFNIYRARTADSATACSAVQYVLVANDEASPYTDAHPADFPKGRYCYVVTEVNDGDEGNRSAAAFVAPTGSDAIAPTIEDVHVLQDTGATGVLNNGDRHRFIFSEAMARSVAAAGSEYTLSPGTTIACGGDDSTCTLYDTWVEIGEDGPIYGPGRVMEVVVGGVTPIPPTPYPADITAVSAGWVDKAGNHLDLASSADRRIDQETTSPPATTDVPVPTSARDIDDGTGNEIVEVTFDDALPQANNPGIPVDGFTLVPKNGTCPQNTGDPRTATAFSISDNDGDQVIEVRFNDGTGADDKIPAGEYLLCIAEDTVRNGSNNGNPASSVPVTLD